MAFWYVLWSYFSSFGVLYQEESGNTGIHTFVNTFHACPDDVAVYIVVSFLPATEETGAMGREIESRQSMGW
jgi:hypothetical protein